VPEALMAGDDLAGRLAALSPAKREQLLARLQERAAEREAPAGSLEPAPRHAPLPLSFGQQQLWLLEQLAPGLPLYNIAAAVQIAGHLENGSLAAALGGVIDRHEALRTRMSMAAAGGGARHAVAEVAPAGATPRLPVLDLGALPPHVREAEAARQQAAEAARGFDLARGPLLRALQLRLAADRHRLLLTLHHIACDGWSVAILVRELAALYAAATARGAGRAPAVPLPPLPLQYADFAAWQRRHLAGERLAALTDWWRRQLADLPPPLPLPLDRVRPPVRSWRGAQRSLPLPPASLVAAAGLGERQQATLFMTLAAVFAALLLRYGGESDVVVGTPVANRARPELEGLIGYFVNTLVLRIDAARDPSFAELVARVRESALAAFAHQELPFELLVSELRPERDLALTPLFQVAFAVEAPPRPVDALAGLRLAQLPAATGSAKFDLTLTCEGAPAAPRATAEYALALFDAPTIDRLLGHFGALLAAAAAAPGSRLSELPLLAAAERHQLLREWNDTAAGAATALPVAQQVAAQARRAPDALAVSDGAACLTYGELAAAAGRLAQWLARRGVEPEVRVALCLGRSAAEVVAMLAVLGAGGAYVPLDPADPDERLAWLVRDCGALLLLARGVRAAELAAALGAAPGQLVVDLDSLALDCPPPRQAPAAASPPAIAPPPPAALAYVIYTSGSTGPPKGVAVTQAGLANLVAWQRRLLGITAGDRTTHLAGPAFDATVLELWPWLTAGAAVEVIDDSTRLQPAALGARLAASGVTHSFLPTPLAESLLAGWRPPPGLALRSLATGGDKLRRPPAGPLPFALWNLYGPTEATVVATAARLDTAGATGVAAPPPIGRPIDGLRVYVLDRRLRPVPCGAAGELCVAGHGVARGYLGRPGETAASFMPDPWADAPGARLYRTGDRARQLADGRLEFLGRLDRQVKVRGFRIEPGEVEAAVAADPEVSACAVLLRADLPGGPGLVAFVTPAGAAGPGTAAAGGTSGLTERLRQGLARRLPAFAMPALIVPLPELPLTANGKLDRRALARRELPAAPDREHQRTTGAAATAPRGEVEETIAAIWRQVLERPAVGRHDSFFDLGGHSLLLVDVHGKLRERFPELQILDLFRYPTVAALAGRLRPEPVPRDPPPPAAVSGGAGAAGPAPLRRGQTGGRMVGNGGDVRDLRDVRDVRGIAVIGMAGRFPGAAGVEELWRNLMAGVEAVQPLTIADLERAGVAPELRSSPAYVRAAAVVDGIELFDAAFFGMTPREAETTDPQHRLLLECAWEVLESAGYDPSSWRGRIGLYAGASTSRYFQHLVVNGAGIALGEMALVGVDKDFLTTRISYRLGLEGPSVTVQTACSTSLVAVHLACQALLAGECDMALAGGVALRNIYRDGYLYEEGGILSPDGHCRAFDAAAAGTVPGDGLGLVVLRRLDDALADGDAVAAVIKGSAINNDGSAKIGYTAPGLAGQVRVLRDALAAAGVDPATISYVEAHGTGTPLGDPIEAAALAEAYGTAPAAGGSGAAVALGSIKTNLGHLDCAAGIAGLIKTVLALRHGAIPPSLHFRRLNPLISQAATRFAVNSTAIRPWIGDGGRPRRAGVSSFGIGGTNAHVILEEAPPLAGRGALPPDGPGGRGGAAGPGVAAGPGWQLLQLSARTEAALERVAANLAGHFERHPETGPDDLADVAFTLRAGRHAFDVRRAVVCCDAAAARAALAGTGAGWTMSGRAAGEPRVAFLLPGQGAQRVGMAASLYRTRPAFRDEIDRVAELLVPHLGADLREILFPSRAPAAAADLLTRTRYAQPALFAVEYAVARLWIGWGIRPAALLGHSIGELVAACLAGVFTLEDALSLVALRGRLVDELPAGAMLAVPLAAADLEPLLTADLSLAAENAADRSVASGTVAAIAGLERRLAARGVAGRRLRTSHAFHSPAMAPAAAPLVRAVSEVERRPPTIPFVSNVTGAWILAEEATDPSYWGRQLLLPVRFAAGLRILAASRPGVLLEAGPGEALSRLARRELRAQALVVLATLPETSAPHVGAPQAGDARLGADEEHLLRTAARLWLAGAPLDPYAFSAHQRRRRVALPTYPFERRHFWLPRPADARQVGAPSPAAVPGEEARRAPEAERRADPADWCYLPSWRRSLPPPPAGSMQGAELPAGGGAPAGGELRAGGYLLFGERPGEPGGPLTAAIAAQLRRAGRLVTLAFPGPAFARLADDAFALRPADPEDHEALWAALAAAGMGCGTVLHLWNAADSAGPAADDAGNDGTPGGLAGPSAAFDAALDRGFYSLMALGRALGRRVARDPLDIWVVSRRLHDVAGGERLAPERATLLGPCRVLPLELPHVVCRSLDLPPLPAAADAALLLAEVAARPTDSVIAYRGRQRWTQDFEPVRLAAGAAPRLRPGCVCLVTGGLGGVGHALARRLARAGARLVLVGRSELPSRERRDQLLLAAPAEGAGGPPAEDPGPARLLRQLRRWRELEEDGAEVLTVTADVADRAALARVRELALDRFGALHGVVHAAGVPGGGIVQLRRRAEAAAVLAPKVQGTLVLAAVFPPEDLDFFVLCSSLNSVLGAVGQADYCAANAFLDAFAAARSWRSARPGAPPGRVISIAWDRWDEAGMAAEAAPPIAPLAPALPAFSGEAVAHPLLDRRLPGEPGRHLFVTRFSAERHWVLAEHRFGGTPVMPGTAFLELARAACALAGGEAGPAADRTDGASGAPGASGAAGESGASALEVRNLSFVAPLAVPDGEACDVFTTLHRAGGVWKIRIASRMAGSGWREHAVGEAAPPGAPQPAASTPPALSDLLASMPLTALTSLADLAPPAPLVFGPRWQGVALAVAAAGDQFLARLELPARFAADLDALPLHPALLDVATGFVHAAATTAAAPYLPFSYTGLRLARPLATVVYSHARRLADAAPPSAAATLRYAVTIYDAAGQVLLTIDEYAFRRVDTGTLLAAPPAPAPAAVLRQSPVPAAAGRAGMSSREGAEVFARILARMTLPQVLVSTRDLRARAAEAAADTGERLLAELAELGAPVAVAPGDRHPRPPLAVPFAAPRDAAEARLAEIWQELLGIERIGVDDDFFELGGDSVLGLRIAALARERGIVLSPNQLFTHPTIAALARSVPAPIPAASAAIQPSAAAVFQPSVSAAGQPPASAAPEDFPHAEVSPRDLAALLAQLDSTGG
jgi:amino acid adenylation domain-containing protein